jgi:hypothetical protein
MGFPEWEANMPLLNYVAAICVVALGPLFAGSANAITLTPTQDAYVSPASVSTNFGALTTLIAGGGDIAFIQFDLSSLAGPIGQADLMVWVNQVNTSGSVAASLVTSAWSGATVTFNSQPSVGSMFASAPIVSAGQFVDLDLTTQAQGWLTTPAANFGVSLAGVTNTLVTFASMEDPNHPPELVISMSPAVPEPSTWAMMVLGFAGVGFMAYRRRLAVNAGGGARC